VIALAVDKQDTIQARRRCRAAHESWEMKKADSRPLPLSSIDDYFVAAVAPVPLLLVSPLLALVLFVSLLLFLLLLLLVVFFDLFDFLGSEAFFSAFGASADGAPDGAGA
jgi:hypothetical protein